ncbi:MAG: signal transduction histidine kinase/CheY-like chemotaxis protein [Pseudohongiellaceae bacterium]|jgi:signal transduction histidine kinase/CheY-like chemotaxis protein
MLQQERHSKLPMTLKLATEVILAVFLLATASLVSGQSITVLDSDEPQSIANAVEYYEDKSESLTLDDVLASQFAVNFLPNNRDILHFGITSSAYWIRFKLDWSELEPGATRVLEFGPPKLVAGLFRGGIQVFSVNDANASSSSYVLGTLTSDREIKTLNRGFALVVDESFGNNFYLQVTSARPLMLPINLWQPDQFSAKSASADLFLGLQYGILLAMIFYNLFLFVTIRESSYIYYVLAISAQALFIFSDSKHLRYLLEEINSSYWLVDMAERNIYPALVITALLFQRSLLRLWEHNPRIDKLVLGLLAGFVVVIGLTFAPNEKIFQFLFVILLIAAIPVAFYTNIDAIRRGNVTAIVHMAAIGVFFAGVIILMLLQLWPAFPNNQFTNNAYNLGLIAQALLLSLSLSFRYNQIKQEKEDAQRLAINNFIRSEKIKDDLLANVSHELRTPLFGINGLAKAALIEFDKDTQNVELITQNLELIQTSGDRLTKLVNDLLDFSSAKESAAYVKFKPVDLHSLVTLVIAVCNPLLGNKKVILRSDIDRDLPMVSGDEDRLQQVLVNLTSNAIKFTYAGEVVISAKPSSDYNITVSVRDTGIGIHKTDHETVFKTFEKLPSQQMNASGIGLGLPLAKRMVEMHKSKLRLSSELDLGSEFSFDLRISLDQTRAVKNTTIQRQMIRRADYLQKANQTNETPTLRSEQETTILVVDDDEINRVVMGQQLEEYTVVKCSNGLDALTSIEESKPDLVLLDLMMPGLNGYEVCQKIRQKYNQIELPVILVTAQNHLEDLTQGFKTGANDYLAKPFHSEELKSRVQNQLRLSLLHRISEDNAKLRSQIENYVEADSELRSSRFRLQQVLETIQVGFIAFELPGKIFSLNQRAAELLGTDKQSLLKKSVNSLFSDSDNNEAIRDAIMNWELGEEPMQTNPGNSGLVSLGFDIEVVYPYNNASKTSSTRITFSSKLKLFGAEEGVGVLFLEDSTVLDAALKSATVIDTVELVSMLGQAQQNIRRIGTRLSVMSPDELINHPAMLDKLSGIEELVQYIDTELPNVSDEGEYRQQLVTLMRSALHTWEVTTQKSKIDLAEESNIWAVSIDDGRLRTRTFDRYLRLEQLPKIPRWREVVRTAYFVLSNPTIEPETRVSLESELSKTKEILKKAAIN